jgi:ATP-binding cassette subfamily B protein
MLLRFFDPQTGAVTLDGLDPREVDPGEWRARFAYVPQEAPIFSGDAAGNVRFGRTDASEDEVREALKKGRGLCLPRRAGRAGRGSRRQGSPAVRRRTPAYRHRPRPRARRACDAAGRSHLARSTPPTSGWCRKRWIRPSQGRTTLVIAHRLATVRKANRIVVFEEGRVVEQGDHESLVRAGGLYAKLADMQFTSA